MALTVNKYKTISFQEHFLYIPVRISLSLSNYYPFLIKFEKKMKDNNTKTFIVLKYLWSYFGGTTIEFIRGQISKYLGDGVFYCL